VGFEVSCNMVLKRILSILASLLLMGAFYIYAVLQKNDETENLTWLVQEEKITLNSIDEIISTDAQILVNSFSVEAPLPEKILSGKCYDTKYKGKLVHILEINAENMQIKGVTPAFAAPLVRKTNLRFLNDNVALFGFPLLKAQDNFNTVYLIVTNKAAFSFTISGTDTTPFTELNIVYPNK